MITEHPFAERKIKAQIRWAKEEMSIDKSRPEHWLGYIGGLRDLPVEKTSSLLYVEGYEAALQWKKSVLTKGRPRTTTVESLWLPALKVESPIRSFLINFGKKNDISTAVVRRMAYDFFMKNADKIRPI